MPKKHHQKQFFTKPASSAPSSLTLSTSSATPSHNESSSRKTVNELLHDSRRAQGHVIASGSSSQTAQPSSSIPPTLRAVLDLPVPHPPSPRNVGRGPNRTRRIPGPPPPRSWLFKGTDDSLDLRGKPVSADQLRTARQRSSLPDVRFPPQRSLQHMMLKSMTSNWQWHVYHDHSYLAELPVALKEMLLSYLAIYNESTESDNLQVLFPHDTEPDENDQVRRLDLSNAIGSWATMRLLDKCLTKANTRTSVLSMPRNDLPDDAVPESWDEAAHETLPTLPQAIVYSSRFKNLRFLSLAATPGVSGTIASWKELLSLANKLPTIVALSLAYWPQPTYTPNASLGRYKVRPLQGSGPTIIYGGSDFYTAFDKNWREAAGILRTLSRSLYCLEWLDLTGCGEWLPALTWRPEDEILVDIGPDWNGSWRRMTHLLLGVGFNPRMNMPLPNTDGRSISEPNEVFGSPIGNATSNLDDPRAWNVEDERRRHLYRKEVERYIELCNCAKKVAQDLRIIRKEGGGGWIDIEFDDDIDA